MKPTDEQVNRLCAEVCGYNVETRTGHTWKKDEDGEIDEFAFETEYHSGPVCERCHYLHCQHCTPPEKVNQECTPIYPNYCTNRNALPELYQVVGIASKQGQFIYALLALLNIEADGVNLVSFSLLTASPRLHCIAALKALQKYPQEWEEE